MRICNKKTYADYIQGLLLDNREHWINFFSKDVISDINPDFGVSAVPIIDIFPDVDDDSKTITVCNKVISFDLSPDERDGIESGDCNYLFKISKAAIDAATTDMSMMVNDLIYAGAPIHSYIIPTQFKNFKIDTTSCNSIRDSALLFYKYITAVFTDMHIDIKQRADIIMIASSTTYDNLLGLNDMTGDGIGGDLVYYKDVLYYKDIPIYCSSDIEENNWGVANKPCLYILHKESFFAKIARINIQEGGIIYDGTGIPKIILEVIYGLGVLDNKIQGMFVNSE